MIGIIPGKILVVEINCNYTIKPIAKPNKIISFTETKWNEMETDIKKRAVIVKDTNEDYHANTDYIGSTSLKKYLRSPLWFKESEQKETEQLSFGSAYHTLVLEPETFKKTYHVYDEKDRPEPGKTMASNMNKAWKAEMYDKYGDKLITKPDYDKMLAMKKRLFSHPYAKYLLTGGENEVSHYTEFEGVYCKFRTDSLILKKSIIADLKTCIDASREKFQNHAADYGYPFSAAYYTDLAEHVYQTNRIWKFYIIAQEKTAPYLFNIFRMSPQALAIGNYEYMKCLEQHKYCLETGEYRGLDVFADNKWGISELNVPNYKIKEINYYNKYE